MKRIVATFLSLMTFVAFADVQLEIKSVEAKQRDMQSGIVDMTVTLQGDAEAVAKCVCTFAATNSETEAAIIVEHVTRNGDDVGTGNMWRRKFIWDAKADAGEVKIEDVALTVVAKRALGGVQLWTDGPYWAECNIGASKPEECGYHFWWGDTVGYKRNVSENGWISVKDSSSVMFIKDNCPMYGKSNSELQSAGYIDSTGNLVAKYDAATAHLGAPWRMPTGEDFSALLSNCDTEWMSCNGVSGRLVKGRGIYASKSIFLPAAGYGNDSDLGDLGSYGFYWSSTPISDNFTLTWRLRFDSGVCNRGGDYRYSGRSVRPVRGFTNGSIDTDGVTTHLSLDNRAHVVRYVDETGTMQVCLNFDIVDNNTTVLTNGFYALWTSCVGLTNIVVNGDVKLILSDDCVLRVEGAPNHAAISVCKGKTLTIFGQEIGSGELICVGGENSAGIGGDRGKSCGKVSIFGGKIQTQGGKNGAGIGGGFYNGAGGAVTIGGGKVVAHGGEEGAGIGSGYFSEPICNGGSLDVLGGDVEAYGGKQAAGIGGGYCCNGATVTVRGGTVWAVGGEGPAPGIGGGYYHFENHGSFTVSANLTVRSGVVPDAMSIMMPDSKGSITINGMPYYSIKAKVPSDDDEDVSEIEWAYTIQNGEATIVNGELSAISIYTVGDVVVPAGLGGCPVTKIGGNAFSKCSNLTSITIPGCVCEIGEYAFSGCKNVRTIKIPDTVSRIGTYAFLNCQSLTSVVIPSGVVELEDRLFSNCYGLLSVSLPKGLKRIGKNVFDCCGLFDLEIPNGVESVGYMAFARTQFDEIVIPNSVTNMGWGAFYAANTRSVILSKNLHEISDNMFWNADGIEEVTLPSCVTNIGGSAFYSCDSLKIVRIVACEGYDETVLTGLKMMLKDSGVDLDKVEIVVVGVRTVSTFYVDSAKGRDTYSGLSPDVAKKTIQAAVDAARDGDTILVAAGKYAPFASKNKSVVIQSASGAATTLIDGTDALRPRVEMLDDTDSTFISVNNKTNTVLVGFTVEHCELIIGGTIQRCVIRDIDARAGGAPINFSIVDNSLILNNLGCNGGAGDNCIFRNCTIVGNRATSGYRCVALNCVLENCIVCGNADNSSGTWPEWLRPMISDVGYREATVFRDNPLFVNAEGGDYRLSKNSPCIDAGDNLYVTSEMDLNGLDRVVNDRVDVGCCEYQHPIVEDGLVAWYKFNGNARDSSGNGNDGVSCGAQLTADRAGNANGAYLFQGADWIQIDSSVSLNSVQDTDEMSFAAWLRIDSYDTWVPIFCKATGADGDPLYDFKYTFGRCFEGCDADLIDLNSVPKVGDWAHVAVTINHGEIVIYQNGNEVGRGSGGAFNSTIPNDALCIGMDSVTYKEFLRGAMDDVRFYNRALTEQEVRVLHAGKSVEIVLPAVDGDSEAIVTGDADTGFVVKPSEGKTAVEVTIPQGVDAAKVTVEVSAKVASVKSNGAKVKVVSGGADITEYLNVPAADGNGVVNLAKATVKEEIVREAMDTEKGAKIELNAADPKLITPNTRVGLFYTFSEGRTLGGMERSASKTGDGKPWSPEIKVKGGNSAFYSIGVGKGE